MKSQRECFLENLGLWEGSFTGFSTAGVETNDVKSLLRLETVDNSQKVKLTLQRFNLEGTDEKVIEYDPSTLYNILFFENGAFSQGSLQWAPFSQFGAELGLIHSDRRWRLVQMFDRNSHIEKLTVIRERRSGNVVPERPRLKLEDLLGTWEGEVIGLSPNNTEPTLSHSRLQISLENLDLLSQELSFRDKDGELTVKSQGTITENTIQFSQTEVKTQLVFLPDGGSALFPLQIESGKPFFLEAGWLAEPTLRYRLIRRYDDRGAWQSLVLVKERKVA